MERGEKLLDGDRHGLERVGKDWNRSQLGMSPIVHTQHQGPLGGVLNGRVNVPCVAGPFVGVGTRHSARDDVAAHFAQYRFLRGLRGRKGQRNTHQAGAVWVGGALFDWIASSSSSNNDFPVSIHRPTSASMFANVNLAIRV